MRINAASETSPMVGQVANGDRAVIRMEDGDRALLAVIDALGHGPEAAKVAQAAANLLDTVPLETPVLDVMRNLHDCLSGSRGAAVTTCIVRGAVIEICAVGNVEIRSSELRLPLVSSPGIVGVRVPKYHPCRTQLARTRVVLFSDGILSGVSFGDLRLLPPADACAEVIRKHRRKEDDATVLIADVA